MPGTLKNYYEILGVSRSATTDQIRTAYRKLLLKFHPDKNIGDVYFEEWSKKINEAFEVLMNPEVRSEYDQVYNETRVASRQRATAGKDVPEDAPAANGDQPVSVDAAIQKLAPVYISAKQAYIKAARNVASIEEELKKKRMNTNQHFILGSVMILAILVWMGITNKKLLKNLSMPLVAKQAAIVPLPGLKKQETAVVTNKENYEPVDLWLKVMKPKTYFFEQPAGAVPGEKFLSKGNKVHAIKKAGNFYYGIFKSSVSAYKIEGWIKMEDVKIVAQ